MSNTTTNPVLNFEIAAAIKANNAATATKAVTNKDAKAFAELNPELTSELYAMWAAQGSIDLFDYSKKSAPKPTRTVRPSNSKVVEVSRRLAVEANASLSCLCPISGLTTNSDLPSANGFFIPAVHPIALNALAVMEQPAYINLLSDAQLAALILSLLAAMDKITITANSNAYLVRAKLETIADRSKMLDIIEWIANSLLVTTRYYPKFTTSHSTLTLESIDEYMEWTYSIEVYSFQGSDYEAVSREDLAALESKTKVKRPKRIKEETSEAKTKRLTRSFNRLIPSLVEEVTNSIAVVDSLPAKLISNLATILKDGATNTSPAIDELIELLTSTADATDSADLLTTVVELAELREAAQYSIRAASEDLLALFDSIEPAATNDEPALTAETTADEGAAAIAAYLDAQSIEPLALPVEPLAETAPVVEKPAVVEPVDKKAAFLAMLAAKASSRKGTV